MLRNLSLAAALIFGAIYIPAAAQTVAPTVAQPGKAWWITGGDWNRYEQIYQSTAIDAVSTAHTPITMRLYGAMGVDVVKTGYVADAGGIIADK